MGYRGAAALSERMDRPEGMAGTDDDEVPLVSVNVSLPQVIGRLRNGDEVLSGIGKRPVTAETLWLDRLNLEGDGQADLSVHGGPDKAVYAYPSEHLPAWNGELGTEFGLGLFGQNLSVEGILEDEARIGDVWAWGEARLQITQPRSPCYKLAMVTGRPDLLRRLVETGRTGWYLRVLRPGPGPVAGPIRVVARDPAGVTVLDAHRTSFAGATRAAIERVVAVDALADDWRGWLLDRLAHSSE